MKEATYVAISTQKGGAGKTTPSLFQRLHQAECGIH